MRERTTRKCVIHTLKNLSCLVSRFGSTYNAAEIKSVGLIRIFKRGEEANDQSVKLKKNKARLQMCADETQRTSEFQIGRTRLQVTDRES